MSDRAQAARSGRKGFKAELEGLRERTRILGHAQVIARLPVPGQSRAKSASDTVTAAWGGIEIEWHYQPPAGQSAGPDRVAASLLAHLAVLDGRNDRKDDPT